jgi:GNAT superfamily N-acetyltransferase
MTVTVRPMNTGDIDTVAEVVRVAAVWEYEQAGSEPPPPPTPEQRERSRIGAQRFIDLDGPGAWVAEKDGTVIGMAESVRRNDFWGLAMLFVHPDHHSQGVGRQLIDKTMEYAQGSRVRMIMTSEDPKALRRYSAAGLAIHPAVQAEGRVQRSAIPSDLPGRTGSVADLDLVAAVDAGLGRNRTDDVAFVVDQGATIDVVDDGDRRGFVVYRDDKGGVVLLGATDDDTAAALLWRALGASGDKTELYCLTAGQDWAVRVALAARLTVKPGGPLFVGGMQPPGPWIPSGWYF